MKAALLKTRPHDPNSLRCASSSGTKYHASWAGGGFLTKYYTIRGWSRPPPSIPRSAPWPGWGGVVGRPRSLRWELSEARTITQHDPNITITRFWPFRLVWVNTPLCSAPCYRPLHHLRPEFNSRAESALLITTLLTRPVSDV